MHLYASYLSVSRLLLTVKCEAVLMPLFSLRVIAGLRSCPCPSPLPLLYHTSYQGFALVPLWLLILILRGGDLGKILCENSCTLIFDPKRRVSFYNHIFIYALYKSFPHTHIFS